MCVPIVDVPIGSREARACKRSAGAAAAPAHPRYTYTEALITEFSDEYIIDT